MIAFRRLAVCLVVALAVVAATVLRAQTVPAAPSGLAWVVNGSDVFLNWTSSPGEVAFYRLEAGQAPGHTFFVWDSIQLHDPSKLPQLLSRFATGGVPPAVYYVRVKAVNAQGGISAASNEVIVPVTGGCQAPDAPTDVTAIVRGTNVFLAWNPGNGGQPTTYTLHASYASGGPVIAAFSTANAYVNVGAVPSGSYAARVYAHTACGTSSPSPDIVVTSPGNSPARTANAATGRLPWFAVQSLVAEASNAAAHLRRGDISCPRRSGQPWITWAPTNAQEAHILEMQKTQRNPYIDAVVARLRQFDQRFGYNAKPTRAPFAQIAGDEIAYHWGSDAPEGSPNVYLIDVLGGHCTFRNEVPVFRPFFDEYGKWTAAGAF